MKQYISVLDYMKWKYQIAIDNIEKTVHGTEYTLRDVSLPEVKFHFDEHCCHKLATGICSLEMTAEEYQEECKNNTYSYPIYAEECVGMAIALQSLEDTKQLLENSGDPIRFSKHTCGHYTGSGQHRICVLLHLNLPIPLETNKTVNTVCDFCIKEQQKQNQDQNQKTFIEKWKSLFKSVRRYIKRKRID